MVARRLAAGLGRQLLRFVGYGVPAIILVALVAAVILLDSRPDLQVWHRARLDEEFTRHSDVEEFAGYLALEDRLFAQLEQEVRSQIPKSAKRELNRFNPGSLSDPQRTTPYWNRSFEWSAENPTVLVLLIHGLTDSPYSLRSVGQHLHAQGAHVLGLRVPGHGTAPSSLVTTDWQDMAAAVDLAARHLRSTSPDVPLVFIGYSNGGALSVQHTLAALEESASKEANPRVLPDALVLLSPAIGITPMAALAVWQERLGHLVGLEKIEWNSINLEYDPYKYGSFPLHAGQLSYDLTVEIRGQVTRLMAAGGLGGFPPTLAFQSLVDATVSTKDVVGVLFGHFETPQHELAIFDIRRGAEVEALMKTDHRTWLDTTEGDTDRSFDLTVVTNEDHPETGEVEAHRYPAKIVSPAIEPIGAAWPKGLYSLAHVALPFPPDDPVYGGPGSSKKQGLHLGQIAPRGERGVLQISPGDILRLRWNPFHDWMQGRIDDWVAHAQRD